ncbi:TetR/AcrR family transcriptional regulator [Sinomonas mesophila]|uniref:TetR/AcrR family transcriptional regulator n=1 Tax=Sinomonas mesophila TaxID=1531955 RepID=UPI00098562AA|nr:TetR/AcrR family transcriptional regulator [Sinomonas mesophila]
MARPPRPERKTELLEQILDYLLESTLADLTFRSLADGLGISSYVLVYHFGNREQLVGEIIRGITSRFQGIDAGAPSAGVRELIEWAKGAFALTLDHRGRHLQRLEFEAAVQDVVAPEPRRVGAELIERWSGFLSGWLVGQGLSPERAKVIGRAYVGAIMGTLYDYVITGDRSAALASFDVLADGFASRLATGGGPMASARRGELRSP